MGLLTLFKRNPSKPAEPAATPDAVAQARTQARRRLIGATLLLAIGVIGFPLLFETQPRPVRMDIPIEIPRKDNAPPLALPPPPAADAASAAAVIAPRAPATAAIEPPVAAASAARPPAPVITERAGEQGRELSAVATRPAAAEAPARPASKPSAATPAPARSTTADGERARAILEGRALPAATAASSAARLVVQVGAYTDADKLAQVRQKVEKLGLKTYVQVVEVDGEKRSRVRVGPFPTKAEADRTAARIKAAGLPVSVLTL